MGDVFHYIQRVIPPLVWVLEPIRRSVDGRDMHDDGRFEAAGLSNLRGGLTTVVVRLEVADFGLSCEEVLTGPPSNALTEVGPNPLLSFCEGAFPLPLPFPFCCLHRHSSWTRHAKGRARTRHEGMDTSRGYGHVTINICTATPSSQGPTCRIRCCCCRVGTQT